jgi:hypothetical protein
MRRRRHRWAGGSVELSTFLLLLKLTSTIRMKYKIENSIFQIRQIKFQRHLFGFIAFCAKFVIDVCQFVIYTDSRKSTGDGLIRGDHRKQ